ncbi:unnamed protein product, partial [Pylaiella littoralis]
RILHLFRKLPPSLHSPQVSATMASTDRDALAALYNATDGANWRQKANWNTDADLSLWHGIAVNDQGRVVQLNISGNNLRGIL